MLNRAGGSGSTGERLLRCARGVSFSGGAVSASGVLGAWPSVESESSGERAVVVPEGTPCASVTETVASVGGGGAVEAVSEGAVSDDAVPDVSAEAVSDPAGDDG